ncbi:heme biosynthesis HemY N-terminal domain-containing protein [Shewanella sp.]|uniref:heme biosynthesis HemY N-terminal domain-containing protein n=1 Tax=Shewanella sp. TaxID=50422 RepID=UPI003561C99A
MIRTLIYLGIILTGLCLSPYLIGNTGYLYLSAFDYEIETSLVFAVVMLVIAYGVIVTVEWLLRKFLNLLLSSRYLPERWRRKAAKKHTLAGALALAEENWADAEHNMVKGAAKGELPALNLLAAARAAQRQGKYAERDGYLELAVKEPLAELAATTSHARYLLQQGELETARVVLEKLSPGSRSKPAIIRLAKELYLAQEDWQALKLLLPAIIKHNLMEQQQLALFSSQINLSLLRKAAAQSKQALDECWQSLSRHERTNAELQSQYALGLESVENHEDAIKWLCKALKHENPEPAFIALPLIATANDTDIIKLIQQLGSVWADSCEYLSALAHLQKITRDNKGVRDSLEKLCQLQPTPVNWSALAQAQEQLGDTHGAYLSYKKLASHLD